MSNPQNIWKLTYGIFNSLTKITSFTVGYLMNTFFRRPRGVCDWTGWPYYKRLKALPFQGWGSSPAFNPFWDATRILCESNKNSAELLSIPFGMQRFQMANCLDHLLKTFNPFWDATVCFINLCPYFSLFSLKSFHHFS